MQINKVSDRNANEAAAIPAGARLSPLDEAEMQDQKRQQEPGAVQSVRQRPPACHPQDDALGDELPRELAGAVFAATSSKVHSSLESSQIRESTPLRSLKWLFAWSCFGGMCTSVVTGRAAPEPEASLSLTRWKQRSGKKGWCKQSARLDEGGFVLGSSMQLAGRRSWNLDRKSSSFRRESPGRCVHQKHAKAKACRGCKPDRNLQGPERGFAA